MVRPHHQKERIDTTVGDLIVALSDAAFELCEDKKAAYFLASIVLEEILKKAPVRKVEIEESPSGRLPDGTVFH